MENLMNISWTLPISLSYVSFIQLNGYIIVSDWSALGLGKPLRIWPPGSPASHPANLARLDYTLPYGLTLARFALVYRII